MIIKKSHIETHEKDYDICALIDYKPNVLIFWVKMWFQMSIHWPATR